MLFWVVFRVFVVALIFGRRVFMMTGVTPMAFRFGMFRHHRAVL